MARHVRFAPLFALFAPVLLGAQSPATPDTASPEPAAAPPVEEELTEEQLELRRDFYNRYTVPVTIGAAGPYRFMVDTGSQATVLTRELAEELVLTRSGRTMVVGMNSRVATDTVEIPELSVGRRTFAIQVAPIIEKKNIGIVDGILGLDSLQNQRVLLDFEDGFIRIGDSEASKGSRGFEIVVKARRRLGQLIIAKADIDGVETSVVVDTGAQGSVGNLALMRKLGRRARPVGTATASDVHGIEAQTDLRMVGAMRIQRMQLSNFPVAFSDAAPFTALDLVDEPALILGLRELRQFKRVAIDFEKRRVMFDMPRSATMEDLFGRRVY